MAKVRTPAHLVERFGLQPEYESVKISGVWEGFRNHAPEQAEAADQEQDPEKLPKKEFLATMWGLQFLGGIEEHGGECNRIHRVPLESLARFWSVDISTACRRLGKFSPGDGRWDEERRRRMSEQQKARAVKEGKQLTGRSMRSVQRVHQFLNKDAGYGVAHLYGLRMPQDLKPRVEEGQPMASPTANVELLAQAFGAEWFDPTQEGINNYKGAPGWTKDLPQVKRCICQSGQLCLLPGKTCPKCEGFGAVAVRDDRGDVVPLYDYGKNLFFHLILKGLMQFGKVDNQTQEKMAAALGCSVDTIVEYREQLELLKIIRVRSGDIKRLCHGCDVTFWCHWSENKDGTGQWVGQCPKCAAKAGTVVDRKPDVWIYVADRMMDEEMAEREYQRFQMLRAKVPKPDFDRAERVHVELLKLWRGREHSLRAFFNAMRRRLASQHMDKRVIDVLFPFFRE